MRCFHAIMKYCIFFTLCLRGRPLSRNCQILISRPVNGNSPSRLVTAQSGLFRLRRSLIKEIWSVNKRRGAYFRQDRYSKDENNSPTTWKEIVLLLEKFRAVFEKSQKPIGRPSRAAGAWVREYTLQLQSITRYHALLMHSARRFFFRLIELLWILNVFWKTLC